MYLHTKRIVVRDLSPSTIGFDAHTGVVKLFDLQKARPVEESFLDAELVGSFRYMAPENLLCQPSGLPSDIYSFGIGYEQAKIQSEGVTSGSGFYVTSRRMWNYVQLFHRDKPINPVTGRKNPTIVNASIGSENYFTGVVAGSFRGTDYGDGSAVLTEAELIAKDSK